MYKIDLNKIHDMRAIEFKYQSAIGHTNGMLYKVAFNSSRGVLYIKLGQFNKASGFYGIEPIVELVNSRIGNILGLPVLDYGLYKSLVQIDGITYETLASVSKDYSLVKGNGNEYIKYSKVCAEELFEKGLAYKKWSTPTEMMHKLNLTNQMYQQYIFDYIICNLDRHGKNTELLATARGISNISLAPFFDNSLTVLVQRYGSGYVDKFTFNDRMPVNNFIGSNNLLDNVLSIDRPIKVKVPKKDDRQIIFQGLKSVTSRRFRDYVWEMLNSRIEGLASLGNNNIILVQ